MSLGVLARRDALDPYRSRSLWVLLFVFVAVFGLVGYLVNTTFTSLPVIAAQLLVVLGPLAALAFTYDSIAGPRENGSLRVLLSYPYSRREVVLGTFLGRVAVVSLAVLVGLAAVLVTSAVSGGATASFDGMAVVAGLALILTTAVVSVAIGISASTSTSTRAAILAFGVYLLFSGFWGLVPTVVRWALNDFSLPTSQPPEWVFVWNQLNPFNAFRSAVEGLVNEPLSAGFYHEPWFGVLVLLAWIVLPVAVGILRFERADL